MVKIISNDNYELLFNFSNKYLYVFVFHRLNGKVLISQSHEYSSVGSLEIFMDDLIKDLSSSNVSNVWLNKQLIKYRGRSKKVINCLVSNGIKVNTIS